MNTNTPLYTALLKEVEKHNIRMHMPGHKGKCPDTFQQISDIFKIDFTELPATGNLYKGLPPISNAEQLMAKAAGADECFFLTGGSTQGIMTAMSLVCPPDSSVLIDRGSHCSVWNAMVHLNLHPCFLYARKLAPWEVTGPITPWQVDAALQEAPLPSAVIITSPTYYGVLSNIKEIAEITSKYNVPLLVDEAHGAHLPFMNGYAGAIAQGASLSVASAHKTLSALTSGAFLFSHVQYSQEEIRRKAAMFGTSSPSYAVMASMDVARAFMEEEGKRIYDRAAEYIKKLRREINKRGIFLTLEEKDGLRLDPTRLTIHTMAGGISGYNAAKILEEQFHIVCEMADAENIVLIITCADSDAELDVLAEAIFTIEKFAKPTSQKQQQQEIPCPVQKLLPREAAYSSLCYLPLKDAVGRIAGENLAPYPPGIPIVATGEQIEKSHITFLQHHQYDLSKKIAVINTL